MEQYNNIQQAYKKEPGEDRRKPVSFTTPIQAVFDAKTGASLEAILAQFNSIYVQYQGTPEATRNIIPVVMRRPGLTITYMNMESETITERANSVVQKDNDHWGLDVNWSRIDELSLSGEISVSAKGTWIINGEDTGVKAVGPKGDNGLTPWLKTIDNRLHYSYDNETWEPCSDYIAGYFRVEGNKLQISRDNSTWETVSDYIAAYFRWNDNKIQISRDNKTWTDLSGKFADNMHIKGYAATISDLPSNAVQGDIYGVGPTYAESDAAHTNPIYRYYVRNANSWVDNGTFTSIQAGIVQETGDSETAVMSQKAVSTKLSELGSELEGVEGEKIELSVGAGAVRIDGTTDYSPNFCKMNPYEVTDETEVEYLLHAHYRGSNNVWLAAIACYDSNGTFMPNASLSGEDAVVGERTLFAIPQGVKYLIVSTLAEYQSTDGLYTKSIKGIKTAISELEDEVTNIENEITDINRKVKSKLLISEGQNIPIQSYETCEKIGDTYKISSAAKLGFQNISSAKTFGLWIFATQRNIDNITSIVFTLSTSDKASGRACTMSVSYAKGIRNGWNFVKFYCPQDFSTENINANYLYIDINAVENTSPTIVVKDIVINQKCKPIVLINYDQMWQNAKTNGVYQYHKDYHIPCTIFSHWNTNLISAELLTEARDMHDNYECELGTYGSFDTTLNPLPTTTDLPTAVEDVVSNASRCMNVADDIVTSYSCTINKSTPTIEQAIKINGFVIGRDCKLSDTGNSFFDKNSMWLGTISYGRYSTKWNYQQYLTRIIDGGYIGVIMTHDVEDTPSADYNDSTEVWMDLLSKVKTYRDNGDIEPMTFRDFYKLVV